MKDETTKRTLPAIPQGEREIRALFGRPEEVDSLLGRIEAIVAEHEPDTSTRKGREAIRSLAAKVTRSKTFLDEEGKKLNAAARAQIEAVDAERRKIRARLDDLRDRARKPLTEWEEQEERRKAALEKRLADLRAPLDRLGPRSPSDALEIALREIEAVAIDESWEEVQGDAEVARDGTAATLRQWHEMAVEREAREAELARLRAAEEERARRDAEEREAREAEARERRMAEERARLAAEAAEREREAAERARREQAAAEERRAAEIRAAEEAAAERARKAAELRAREEREARERAARDYRVREKIREDAILALLEVDPFTAGGIAEALMDGRIPHFEMVVPAEGDA